MESEKRRMKNKHFRSGTNLKKKIRTRTCAEGKKFRLKGHNENGKV